jgi:predicted transcriptional regulator
VFTSRLAEPHFKKGLSNLKKTPLVHSKRNAYRISDIGEKVVDMIRKDQVEISSKRSLAFSLDNLKRFLGFEAE